MAALLSCRALRPATAVASSAACGMTGEHKAALHTVGIALLLLHASAHSRPLAPPQDTY